MPAFNRRHLIGALAAGAGAAAIGIPALAAQRPQGSLKLSDAEWRRRLSPATYRVLREADTERPFTSPLLKEHRKGRFACAGCDLALFSSATKYDSKTGWPSFWQALPGAVGTRRDFELGYPRNEVFCKRCGGHLGHVFDDGPRPTGKRFCMNGVAMRFHPGAA